MQRCALHVRVVVLIMTVTHRRLATLVQRVGTLLRMRRHARIVVQDWLTWTAMPRPHAFPARLARMLWGQGQAAMHVKLVLLTWTPMPQQRVNRVGWASTRLQGLSFVWHVCRVGLTRTLMHRHRAVCVVLGDTPVVRTRRVMGVRSGRLTLILMRLHPASCVMLVNTPHLWRRCAPTVLQALLMLTAIRRQCVRRVSLGGSHSRVRMVAMFCQHR